MASKPTGQQKQGGGGTARVVQSASNRAVPAHGKGKAAAKPDNALERKTVYKSVLDNPFRVNWPNIPLNVQNSILACLIELLDESGLSAYHAQRESRFRRKNRQQWRKREVLETENASKSTSTIPEDGVATLIPAGAGKKRKRETADGAPRKKLRGEDGDLTTTDGDTLEPLEPSTSITTTEPPLLSARVNVVSPALLDHITIGINEVTKRIERDTLLRRTGHHPSDPVDELIPTSPIRPPCPPPKPPRDLTRFIFICRSDVDPPALINHFPMLIAACNSSSQDTQNIKDVLLITLPKGSEVSIAAAVGLRRVAVFALDASTPGLDSLQTFAQSIPTLRAPWLRDPRTPLIPHQLIPTHIKQLKTTAPKDMKAAKELRTKEIAEAKARKKAVKSDAGVKGSSGTKKRWGRRKDRDKDLQMEDKEGPVEVSVEQTAPVPGPETRNNDGSKPQKFHGFCN